MKIKPAALPSTLVEEGGSRGVKTSANCRLAVKAIEKMLYDHVINSKVNWKIVEL